MAKANKIYEQDQALSVYFRDMLAETQSTPIAPPPEPVVATKTETPSPVAAVTESEPAPPAPTVQSETEIHRQGDIKLLLCDIAGMSLALPVSALNNIVRWPDEPLTRLPGQAEWNLGVFSQHQQHTTVIDISYFLQPEHQHRPQTALNYILLVGQRRWGIACDQIKQIVTLPIKDINWRSDTTQRPWFSGVITDQMSNVVDIPALLAAIQAG